MNKIIALLVFASVLGGCAGEELGGAWRSQVQFTSGDFASVKDLEFLYVFNDGGTMTESSNYDSSPPVPPAYGIWRRVNDRTYEAKYVFYTTKPPEAGGQVAQGWAPSGCGGLWEEIVLAPDGKSFESKIRLQLFDASGKAITGGGEGVGRGRRMEF